MQNQNRVLIVDDSRVSKLMTRAYILSKFPNWEIDEASTGEEALEKAKSHGAPIILIDVNMPGMGGLAAAEQLRKLYPTRHITLLTANVQDATRDRAHNIGVGFMEKLVTEARIHQLIGLLVN